MGAYESELEVGGRRYRYYPIDGIEGHEKLPYSLSVLLENVLRNAGDEAQARKMASRIVEAGLSGDTGSEVEFAPARVLFQDFTGVPVFVDFAAMRDACADAGGDVSAINPQVQCDMVIDHSVIADEFGTPGCREVNEKIELLRNRERYEFLKWSQESFDNVRIVPPGKGICHQLNIENFADVVMTQQTSPEEEPIAYFDTLVGTDSHTTTANGIGVLGWGVGGIEAEAAALGQPIPILVPKVIGMKLVGELAPGVSAMDVALAFAEKLRAKGVVGCFVECFGPGVASLSATQRSTISNMTPEYGCTCTLFPVDSRTLDFLKAAGRSPEQIELAEAYSKSQGFWLDENSQPRTYSEVIELDLSDVKPSLAGPSRPHERIERRAAKEAFREICSSRDLDMDKKATVHLDTSSAANAETTGDYELGHGAIAIAAVTSCTTVTDPEMMLAAGLVARNAAARGLKPKPWVKTVFAPGSHATEIMLDRAGLVEPLQKLGFYTCGFGCMSCIGNSGPILPAMHDIAQDIELASVLSGNRNFEGRISPDVSQNYLASPANVIAYALVGDMDFDIENDALGEDQDGSPVYLRDIEPDPDELGRLLDAYVTPELYAAGTKDFMVGSEGWQALSGSKSDAYEWDADSTYIHQPPYFIEGETPVDADGTASIDGARVLALLGDFITTDHISPAGAIAADSPAARYLESRGVKPEDFNTYGSRRGNDEVMVRGTFANVKLENKLAEGRRGSCTRDWTTGELTSIFDAAENYKKAGIPSIVVAGKMYGSGSSRDWAAKGVALLGVKAVIAESFERIHRSNLIGMGILPLQFEEGTNAETLGLTGEEVFSVAPVNLSEGLPSPQTVEVTAKRPDGSEVAFPAIVRIDTPTEGEYYKAGGILQYVLNNLIAEER